MASICFDLSSKVLREDIAIHRRPTPESLESLRLTLQKLEQSGDARKNDTSISELKRVVLNRIADLELAKKLAIKDEEVDNAPEPADLIPLPPMAEEDPREEAVGEIQLDKLD